MSSGAPTILPAQWIQTIAQQLPIAQAGITQAGVAYPLAPHVCAHLVQHVEQRVRTVITDAHKLARHSKRKSISCEDINASLRMKNQAPIYGYASCGLPAPEFQNIGDELFIIKDQIIDLEKDVIMNSLPNCCSRYHLFVRVPADPTFSVHWLAIQGIQPRIPQNPTPSDNLTDAPMSSDGFVEHVTVAKHDKEVVIKPAIKHTLSKEQLSYYEYVITGLKGNDPTLQHKLSKALSSEAGLQQLVPYFVQFACEQISQHLTQLSFIRALVNMLNCLLQNPHLHCEPYLHQITPCILTCLLAKQLCATPQEDHWTVRDFCADIIVHICNEYSVAYVDLASRVSAVLHQSFLDLDKSLSTHYGAIVAISKLGTQCTKSLILPYLTAYIKVLTPLMNSVNDVTRMQASNVYHALLSCVGDYVRQQLVASITVSATHSLANIDTAQKPIGKEQAAATSATAPSTSAPSSPSAKRRRLAADLEACLSRTDQAGSTVHVHDTLTLNDLLDIFGESLHSYIQSALNATGHTNTNAGGVLPSQAGVYAATNLSVQFL